MSYLSIDHVIQKWAVHHGLQVYKSYKGDEVRSVEERTGPRTGFQIWIDVPTKENMVGIHVWNLRKLRKDLVVDVSELEEYLEQSIRIAKAWQEQMAD